MEGEPDGGRFDEYTVSKRTGMEGRKGSRVF
jgi:hypothetical protein